MDHLILVDSVSPVPQGYSPVLSEVCGVLLEETAARACREMLAAAEKDGAGIRPISGYRTKEYQQLLRSRSIHGYMSEGLSPAEAIRLTDRYLAKAGHSEHETGLACDFSTPDSDDTLDDLAGTEAGQWLCRHAADHGFILRYPRMKEHITGIAYEPWHYRYVGLPHSKVITVNGLTLEEYLHYRNYCSE